MWWLQGNIWGLYVVSSPSFVFFPKMACPPYAHPMSVNFKHIQALRTRVAVWPEGPLRSSHINSVGICLDNWRLKDGWWLKVFLWATFYSQELFLWGTFYSQEQFLWITSFYFFIYFLNPSLSWILLPEDIKCYLRLRKWLFMDTQTTISLTDFY